jgi:hypothetical protein
MGDDALEAYIDLAEDSPFAFKTLGAIPSDAQRTNLWALYAAHLATVMAEPEPVSTRIGPMSVSLHNRSSSSALGGALEGLGDSAPGREFAARWRRYNVGRWMS